MKRSDRQARPDSDQPEPAATGDAWAAGLTYLAVFVITAITAAVSYEHEYELARRNGQAPWVSSALPFTVDGLILGASVVLLWAGAHGIRRPLRPVGVLLVGIGATIAANLAAGWGYGWLGAAVSAWSGLSLILISDVGVWLTTARRNLAGGDTFRPVPGCSCPPPPVSLAEALPLARAELARRGDRTGEQALADRFGVPRNQVRNALRPPGELAAASLNGSAPDA